MREKAGEGKAGDPYERGEAGCTRFICSGRKGFFFFETSTSERLHEVYGCLLAGAGVPGYNSATA